MQLSVGLPGHMVQSDMLFPTVSPLSLSISISLSPLSVCLSVCLSQVSETVTQSVTDEQRLIQKLDRFPTLLTAEERKRVLTVAQE